MNVTCESMVAMAPVPPIIATPDQSLHCLCEVRRREGLTRQQVARRLGVSVKEVERQEQSSSDLLVSDLRRWQKVLAVPIAELLAEPEGDLSTPVRLRSRLLRAMKTVRSIQQRARQTPVRRLVETLVAQLVEVMPELADTAPWPAVGHRRKKHDFGQAFFRRLPLDPWEELEGPEG
jgi:transcriptional regulator with XRE-family HTH domain